MALNTLDINETHKNPGRIYFGLAIPASGAELTLTSGVPDATENPNAKQVGLTNAGARVRLGKSFTEEVYDEYPTPVERTLDTTSMVISAEAAQILNWDLFQYALTGIATTKTVSGKKKVTIGKGTITPLCVAVVSPRKADPTKYFVSMIYKATQTADVEYAVARQERSAIPLELTGDAVAGRAEDDSVGQVWYETTA